MPLRLVACIACVSVAVATVAGAASPAAPLAGTAAASPHGTPMGYGDARHLLLRTGFAPTDAEVRDFAALTREQGVERLLRDAIAVPVTTPPAFVAETTALRYPNANTAPVEERRAFQQMQTRQGLELRAWWLQEMLATPSPLTERMTLFWHNHFVSSQQKVRFTRLMYAQNATFRANALGNFGTLLHAASKEPAMLIYLDGAQSRKQQPNENFAREVMELFTLGEGHYGEQDIKEAARAFTGWSVDRDTGTYVYRPATHDTGSKTVFGNTGNLDGDAVLDLLLARSETSRFITAKLWREFVSPQPDPREVERVAAIFRGRDYDIKAALRALFLSNAFWAAENRGTLVKSPAELVVGTLRQLDVEPTAALPFAIAAAGMGQNLFAPPNVKGWPGGEAWINSNTLLARKQFLDRLARVDDARPAQPATRMDEARQALAAARTEDARPTLPVSRGATEMDDAGGAMTRVVAPARAVPLDDASLVELRAPRAAIVAANGIAADDDRARTQRFNQALDRAMRSVGFNAARWVGKQPGDTPLAKMQSIRVLLLPIDAVLADAPTMETEPGAFLRATLLDPAYQLK